MEMEEKRVGVLEIECLEGLRAGLWTVSDLTATLLRFSRSE